MTKKAMGARSRYWTSCYLAAVMLSTWDASLAGYCTRRLVCHTHQLGLLPWLSWVPVRRVRRERRLVKQEDGGEDGLIPYLFSLALDVA